MKAHAMPAVERQFQVTAEHQRDFLLSFLPKQPLPLLVTVGPLRKRRTWKSNARLWLLHTAASEVTGYTPDEMHEEALCKHYGYTEQERKDLFTGEITTKRIPLKRSRVRDTKEFAKFMEATEIWYGTEFGVWLEQDA
jgi:hypothetical protein